MLSVEASAIAGAVDADMPDQIKHVATGVVRGVMPDLSAQVKIPPKINPLFWGRKWMKFSCSV